MAQSQPQLLALNKLWGTCRVTDVQVHHILLVHEEHLEVLAAGCQHCFVGLKVNTVHHKSAVTQKPQLPLLVQLLQDMLAVLGEIHGWGEPKGLRVSTEQGRRPASTLGPRLPGEKCRETGRITTSPQRTDNSSYPLQARTTSGS